MGNTCAKKEKEVTQTTSQRSDTSASDSKSRKGLRAGLVQTRANTNVYRVYENGRKIGEGMTGAVRVVKHRITNQEYAMKCMERGLLNPALMEDLRNEISILQVLDHPNVIKLYETYEDEDNLYLILEYCSGGELYDRLHAQPGRRYEEAQAARLVFKMLSAIAYCHGKGISHRDLKLENFIFDSKAADSNIKLIDFGLSKKYGTGIRRMKTQVGTPYYMSPEVVASRGSGDGGYTEACDLWSMGVITYMLLSGTPPFSGANDRDVMLNVASARFTFPDRRFKHISSQAKDFISALLRKNPSHRLSAAAALSHPWLTSTAEAIRSTKLDASVVRSLRRFSNYTAIKRVALEAIAFSMNAQQIRKMRHAFVQLDKDHTGVVTLSELVDVLKSEGFSKEEAEAVFRNVDRDGTQRISYSEFLAASLDRRYYLQVDRIRDAFQRLDVSNTGYISADDLRSVMGEDYTEEAVKKMLKEADIAGDGRINFEEFLRVVTDESKHEVDDMSPEAAAGPGAGAGAGAGASAGAGAGTDTAVATPDARRDADGLGLTPVMEADEADEDVVDSLPTMSLGEAATASTGAKESAPTAPETVEKPEGGGEEEEEEAAAPVAAQEGERAD